MKKLIYILLFLPFFAIGQVSNGTETVFEALKTTSSQIVTTSDFITTTGSDGTQGKILGENISLSVIPPVHHFTPITSNIKGYFQGVDNALGNIVATTAGTTTRLWLTADQTTITAGTFYKTNFVNKGIVASATQSVSNNDNEKKYFTQDIIGDAYVTITTFPKGVYAGNLSVSTSPNSARQRFTVEVYKCNNAGTPIPSGVSGAVTGSLGVTVIAILDSGVLTLADGSVTNVPVSASIEFPFTVDVSERVRYHISAEKVGTNGASIAESLYLGTSYNSYIDVPVPLNTSAVQNLSAVTGSTTTDALNTLNTLKEDKSNKVTDFTTINNTLYPSVQAVQNGLNSRQLRTGIYYKGKDIEFFGDSYTVGTGASPTSNRWTSIISSALGANEINHGVAGTTMQKRTPIDYMASPNMVDNVVNIPTKTASKAMLVFAFGLNDMGQTAPDYNTANYKTDYQFVINNAFSKGWLPNQILIIPAYYIGSAGYASYATITGNAAPTESRHLAFIQAAKEVAATNNTMYFDIYQDQKKNDITLIGVDNIHPTNSGYAYIANDVLQYLGQDKLSITTDTNYSSDAGFFAKINGNKLDNSFLYQTLSAVGLATINPKSTFHVNSTTSLSSVGITTSVTTDAIDRGASISMNSSSILSIINRENAGIELYTNNIPRFGISEIGNTNIIGKLGINASLPNYSQQIFVAGGSDVYSQFTNGTSGSTASDGFILGLNTSNGVEIANKENGFMRFSTNNLERLRIHTSGGVSIGNTTDLGTGTLNVTGNVTTIAATTANHVVIKSQLDAVVRPYKVLSALFTQTSTNNPVVTVLENTLGTVTFTYSSVGVYLASSSALFTTNKTFVLMNSGVNGAYINGANLSNTSQFFINTKNITTAASANDGNNSTALEIRVYP